MSFSKDEIIMGLKDYPEQAVEEYATYCIRLLLEKDKEGKPRNEFIQKKTALHLIKLFKKVAKDGLFIDGDTITINKNGISYDYKAYKNMLMIKYPESIIDYQLVYKDDKFSFTKQNGEVKYSHEFTNPFEQKDDDVIGGYCIVKNKRGQFITTMGKQDIEKCRKVAKTDKIWQSWYKQMCLKTVIKSACSLHFYDIYQNILQIDNETENDIDNSLDLEIIDKKQVDDINTLAELRTFYNQNKEKCVKVPELLKYIQKRQAELKEEMKNA